MKPLFRHRDSLNVKRFLRVIRLSVKPAPRKKQPYFLLWAAEHQSLMGMIMYV